MRAKVLDATPGTKVIVPAGVAHAYRTVEPSRYLMISTPKIDRLIETLPDPSGVADPPSFERAIAIRVDVDAYAGRRSRDRARMRQDVTRSNPSTACSRR